MNSRTQSVSAFITHIMCEGSSSFTSRKPGNRGVGGVSEVVKQVMQVNMLHDLFSVFGRHSSCWSFMFK